MAFLFSCEENQKKAFNWTYFSQIFYDLDVKIHKQNGKFRMKVINVEMISI